MANREVWHPKGVKRWWRGKTPLEGFLDVARRFDGTNERSVNEWALEAQGLSVIDSPRSHLFGMVEPEDVARVKAGLAEVVRDHLTDVVDVEGQPTMLLRSGTKRPIEPGSFLVNATGYLGREDGAYEPYVSEGGRVVSISQLSMTSYLTSHAGYLLTHLLYLGKLRALPLYELDLCAVGRSAREAWGAIVATHTLLNAGLILRAVPIRVVADFGADPSRWYPWYRQALSFLRLGSFVVRHPRHFRRSLDTVRERFAVRCGPLPHIAA
jgi:hypothetical protein